MMSRLTLFKSIAIMLGAGFAALAGTAQAATCGITGNAISTGAVYDPFNSTQATAHVSLNLIRTDPPVPPAQNGTKTAVVSFYLTSTNPAATGTQIIATSISVSGGALFVSGANVFYNTGATGPSMGPPTSTLVPTSGNAYIKVAFTGNNAASDPATVNFDVILPPGSNFNASTSLLFDATYRCTTTGGGPQTDQSGSLNGAMTFPITVLSGLRTYFAGTALDFGEIGAVTQVPADYSTKKTSASNYVSVQSSGAYSVTLSSQNGFQLFKPSAATTNDKVKYSLRFLGQTVDSALFGPGATAVTASCHSATLTGNVLPIQATLKEGGQGKNPSPTYLDVLTVTVTPLMYSDVGISNCASFTL